MAGTSRTCAPLTLPSTSSRAAANEESPSGSGHDQTSTSPKDRMMRCEGSSLCHEDGGSIHYTVTPHTTVAEATASQTTEGQPTAPQTTASHATAPHTTPNVPVGPQAHEQDGRSPPTTNRQHSSDIARGSPPQKQDAEMTNATTSHSAAGSPMEGGAMTTRRAEESTAEEITRALEMTPALGRNESDTDPEEGGHSDRRDDSNMCMGASM
ncbi:hypothetical protein CC78DRAFT_588084 [Lojkania enalia]|uniref:Uncharacterized protein n=1 Tax=Lojkania enalia TaxID=147567 RepID=A0A9P4JV51_9PLEO|nr:hypothetical protein CC78DRAFT_588084 [Didymosphaeria enalia]